MKLAYPAFAVAKANAKGKCCERRRRSRAQCLSACTGVVDFFAELSKQKNIECVSLKGKSNILTAGNMPVGNNILPDC